jgi:hypothetical protein
MLHNLTEIMFGSYWLFTLRFSYVHHHKKPIYLKQMGSSFLSACLLLFYFNTLTRTILLPDSETIAQGPHTAVLLTDIRLPLG